MNTASILGGLGVLLLIGQFLFDQGRKRGEKSGYQRGHAEGYRAGHKAADDWWLNWEHEVMQTREKIQHEAHGNEEGWP